MIEIVVVDLKAVVVKHDFLYQILNQQFRLLLDGMRQIFDDFFLLRQPTKTEKGSEGAKRTCRKADAKTARRCGRIGGVNENGQENIGCCPLGRNGIGRRLLGLYR